MQELKVKVNGIVPILMHDNKGANPQSVWAKELKALTSKKNKTDADYELIGRVEWESGLYMNDGVVALPLRVVDRCFQGGAKKTKNGKKYETGVFINEDYFPLSYKGDHIRVNPDAGFPNPELDKHYAKNRHQEMVRVGTAMLLRTRPIFYDWSFEVSMTYDENEIDRRTLISCLEDAGRRVGLCEKRPRLGRFEIEVLA